MRRVVDTDVLVIGSGPGGATTAALLAEAGLDVLLVEEGDHHAVDSTPDHSIEQMDQKWRNGGLTKALGDPGVSYIEGRCVGGASESNAGLYHPPFPDGLEAWAETHQLPDFGADALAPFLAQVESELGVSRRPNGFGPASQALADGGEAMGWRWCEIQRFWRYAKSADGTWSGRRRSMTETLIPRALKAGCQLMSQTRVERILFRANVATTAVCTENRAGSPSELHIRFSQVWVCAGAVQTPLLLRRSGVRGRVGDTLTMNPMIRLVARFDREVNVPALGVPVVQIEQFKPAMTLGCSYSAVPHLAMWLDGSAAERTHQLRSWKQMAVFYVKVSGEGRGKVRNLPGFGDALVRQPVTDGDLLHLGDGLTRLSQALFAAGATTVFNPLAGGAALTEMSHANRFRGAVTRKNTTLSAIHLHSTCPMGGDPSRSVVDPWGCLHGRSNVRINDSSLLPSSPGVNPQGTIMAIARRNIARSLAGG
jgi:choline dehydrogenase-like flavoprotein